MAEHHDTRNPSENKLSRRQALAGTAAVGALAVPAGAALSATGDADHPLLVLWREHVALGVALDEDPRDDDPRWDRITEIDREIEAARPDDLIGLTVQASYAAYWSRIGTFPDEVCAMALHASLGLARHAGVALPEWRP